jgi:hypothetical protein
MTNNPITFGTVIYRRNGEKIEFFGIVQTKEKALKDIEILSRVSTGWECIEIPFVGWGQVAPEVFSQNGKPTLTIVPKNDHGE